MGTRKVLLLPLVLLVNSTGYCLLNSQEIQNADHARVLSVISDPFDIDHSSTRFGTGPNAAGMRTFVFSSDSNLLIYPRHQEITAIDATDGNYVFSTIQFIKHLHDDAVSRTDISIDGIAFDSPHQLFVSVSKSKNPRPLSWNGPKSDFYKVTFGDQLDERIELDAPEIQRTKMNSRIEFFCDLPTAGLQLFSSNSKCLIRDIDDNESVPILNVERFPPGSRATMPWSYWRELKQDIAVSHSRTFVAMKTMFSNDAQGLRIWEINKQGEVNELVFSGENSIFMSRRAIDDKKRSQTSFEAFSFSPVKNELVVAGSIRSLEQTDPFDENRAWVGSSYVKVLNLETKVIRDLRKNDPFGPSDEAGKIKFICFSGDGSSVISVRSPVSGSTDKRWTIRGKYTLKLPSLIDVAVSRDSHLATIDESSVISIYDRRGRSVARFVQKDAGRLLFSPDGQRLACHSTTGRLSVYDVKKLVNRSTYRSAH